jgi:hypothetical protein
LATAFTFCERILSHKGWNPVSDMSAPRPTPTAYRRVYCTHKAHNCKILGCRFGDNSATFHSTVTCPTTTGKMVCQGEEDGINDYSRISLSGTSISQLNSPALSKLPLKHRDLWGDKATKAKESVPLRPNPAYTDPAYRDSTKQCRIFHSEHADTRQQCWYLALPPLPLTQPLPRRGYGGVGDPRSGGALGWGRRSRMRLIQPRYQASDLSPAVCTLLLNYGKIDTQSSFDKRDRLRREKSFEREDSCAF